MLYLFRDNICRLHLFYLAPFISDINNQSYIRYEGVFFVEGAEYDLRSGAKPIVKFSEDEKGKHYKVCGNTYLQDGYHDGYIVYAERSGIIVEWYCDSCNE